MRPELPPGASSIPAMTSEAERQYCYEVALERAGAGEVVELGTWLGACTAYIAAGVRDSGAERKVHAYDRFIWRPDHTVKSSIGLAVGESFLPYFKTGLGGLLRNVEVHSVNIDNLRWDGGDISVAFLDMPKRVGDISRTLTRFGPSLRPGSLMVWQDFSLFTAFEIPACLWRLREAGRIELVRAVTPGTMVSFRVLEQWEPIEVSAERLSLRRWSARETDEAWSTWIGLLPEASRPLFSCGALMMLCDVGEVRLARTRFRRILSEAPEAILPKWRDISRRRSMTSRYAPLFEELASYLRTS